MRTQALFGSVVLVAAAYGFIVVGCSSTGQHQSANTATQVPTPTSTPSPTNTNTYTPTASPTGTLVYWFLGAGYDSTNSANAVVQSALTGGGTLSWITTSVPLPTPVGDGCLVADASHVYEVGGALSSQMLVTTGTVWSGATSGGVVTGWTSQSPLPTPFAAMEAILDRVNGVIVAWGGELPSGTPSSFSYGAGVWAAAVAAGTVGAWSTTNALPEPMAAGGAAFYNGYAYAIGGAGGSGLLVTHVYYAPTTSSGVGAWTSTSALPIPLAFDQAAADGGYVYIVGGDPNNGSAPIAYSAPVVSGGALGSWTSTSAPSIGIIDGRLLARGPHVYLAGGMTPNGGGYAVMTTTYAANLSSGAISGWTTTAALPTPLYRLGGTGQ